MQKVKQTLLQQGDKSLRTLSKILRSFPSFDGEYHISKEDFYQFLINKQVRISKQEAEVL